MKWLLSLTLPLVLFSFYLSHAELPLEATTEAPFDKLLQSWRVLHFPLVADFNQDGLNDVAMVLESKTAQKSFLNLKSYPRKLQIYTQTSDNKYVLLSENTEIVLEKDQGGRKGDPFESLTFENNTLILRFTGGSSWAWETEYHFQFSQQNFWLSKYYEVFTTPAQDKFHDTIYPKSKLSLSKVSRSLDF